MGWDRGAGLIRVTRGIGQNFLYIINIIFTPNTHLQPEVVRGAGSPTL